MLGFSKCLFRPKPKIKRKEGSKVPLKLLLKTSINILKLGQPI